MSNDARAPNAEAKLASFFARYEPKTARLGKALRAKLRDRLPGLNELVYLYENQRSLVIAYSPTESGLDGLCSIALYPDGVKLYFNTQGGRLLKSDPSKLLQGRGKAVRFVGLSTVAEFDSAELQALTAAALKLSKLRFDAGAKGSMLLKAGAGSISAPA